MRSSRVYRGRGEAVHRPGLPARPRRVVRHALVGAAPPERTRPGLVVRHVERAAVGAHEVVARPERVLERNPGEAGVAAVLPGPEQQLDIHHRVDDDREAPVRVPVAAINRADFRPVSRRDRGRAGEEHVAEGGIAGEPVRVPVARKELEPRVVRHGVRLLAFEAPRERLRTIAPRRVAGELVLVPEAPGEEALRPADDVIRGHRSPEAIGAGALRQLGRGEPGRGARELVARHRERVRRGRVVERCRDGGRGEDGEGDEDGRGLRRATRRRTMERPPGSTLPLHRPACNAPFAWSPDEREQASVWSPGGTTVRTPPEKARP